VCLLPGAARFGLSRCAPSTTAHCSPLREKHLGLRPNCFFVSAAHCVPAPGRCALRAVTLRALRDGG
ncbi:hypothetical protein, partial [Intestinimonas butyriciproducens]|uniref:hypothetical protein n=1 Tax=Intestinimonas butyriciproducens TaxID=1297617 RepID=UPI001AB0442F